MGVDEDCERCSELGLQMWTGPVAYLLLYVVVSNEYPRRKTKKKIPSNYLSPWVVVLAVLAEPRRLSSCIGRRSAQFTSLGHFSIQ